MTNIYNFFNHYKSHYKNNVRNSPNDIVMKDNASSNKFEKLDKLENDCNTLSINSTTEVLE